MQLFQSIQNQDPFLALFPHRYDFLWAKHPQPGERPQWQTERRYPLSDRDIDAGKHLYGVRFGPKTAYLLLDIDTLSLYHPKRDRQILGELLAPLEQIGITEAIAVQSSRNQGIHLYIPIDKSQDSWAIALVAQTLIESAGFVFKSGQLEIFPNARKVSGATPESLYNGHRLPLQNGSYLLNSEWDSIFTSKATFVERWKFAQKRNQLDVKTFQRILKQAKRKQYSLSSSAKKFLDDLTTEIEPGWTGQGQTNQLLGRIAMQLYIFGSMITGNPTPLTGEALTAAIVSKAMSLPGYEEFCNHQHEIEQRAQEFARSIENSKYFPYGQGKLQREKPERDSTEPTWNKKQCAGARMRIQAAIAQLIDHNEYPDTISGRIAAFEAQGIHRGTLYNHLDLWHPNHQQSDEFSPEFNPNNDPSEELEPNLQEDFNPVSPNKFPPVELNFETPDQASKLTDSDEAQQSDANSDQIKRLRLILLENLLSQNKLTLLLRLIERSFLTSRHNGIFVSLLPTCHKDLFCCEGQRLQTWRLNQS